MDVSPSALFAGLIFSSVGMGAWMIGRRRQSGGKMALGLVLMGLPFVVPDPWIWLVGGLGCAALWIVP